MSSRRSVLAALLVAVIATAAVAVIRVTLWGVLGDVAPFLPFTLAVVVATAFGGWQAGILATLLGAVAGTFLFVAPRYSLRIASPDQAIALVLYLALCGAILWGVHKLFEARRRARVEREARLAGERTLLEQEEQLERITDNTAVLLARCTRDLRYRFVNRACAEFIGLPREEIVGRPLREVLGPGAFEAIHPYIVRVLAGESIDWELEIPYRTGRRFMHVNYVPDRNAAGEVEGWFASLQDISGRRVMELALRESEERFRELANNIDQFAWTCDRLGEATWYNRRWYDYTGTTFEEMKGDGWKRVHHPAHVDRVLAGLEKCIASGKAWEDTFPLRGKGGEYRWFLSRAIPIRNEAGEVVRWLGTNTDVTELRELQEALREADRRKDEFLATLAHELRNPLAPVRNAIQVLRLKGPPAPELQWARNIIDRQIQQMTRLIDDLMDVSRITHDNLELRKERVELAQALHGAIETSRPVIDQARQELTLRLPSEPMFVDADPTRLAQVFSNLLNNAARYSDAPGTILLSAERRGSEVEVVVRDQGIGISAEMLPRVFDLFVQAGEPHARRNGGLGIGLTLVKRLVEMHGGTVRAESGGVGTGTGSAFTVRLPLAAGPAEPAPPDDDATPKAEGRVLLVDDNRDAVESLGLLLQAVGYETRLTFDGPSALAAAAEALPDVALLDIGMPEMSGHEVARRIREMPGGRDVALVAITGWGQAEDRRKSEEAGFDRHLVKPVDPRALLELLRELTTKRGGAAA